MIILFSLNAYCSDSKFVWNFTDIGLLFSIYKIKSSKLTRYKKLLCLNSLSVKRICICMCDVSVCRPFICIWYVNCFIVYDFDEVCQFAETISKFGSGMFLLVQVMLLLDFVHGWNDKWVGYDEQFWLVLGFAFLFLFFLL